MLRKDLESTINHLQNKKIFLRVDFNVPIKNNQILDTFRIDSSIKTIKFLKEQNTKIAIFSHLEIKDQEKASLILVYEYIKDKYPELNIRFSDLNNIGFDNDFSNNIDDNKKIDSSIILYENLRTIDAEKNNDIEFAKKIANKFDIYVFDAFAVSHREHMSVSAIKKFFKDENKFYGFQILNEINNLDYFLNPEKPFAVIISGMKFSTKLPLIKMYEDNADIIMVGGALYNNLLNDLGYNTGKSLIDNTSLGIFKDNKQLTDKIYLPKNVLTLNCVNDTVQNKNILDIQKEDSIMDFDISSIDEFINRLNSLNIKSVLWNGPVGNYEDVRFKKGTVYMGERLIELSKKGVSIAMGGGDTVAALNMLDKGDVFVSTGGGAMLDYLEKRGILPGIV